MSDYKLGTDLILSLNGKPMGYSATCKISNSTETGERVTKGQPLLTLHTDDEWRIPRALEALSGAIEIADGVAPEPRRVVLETVS